MSDQWQYQVRIYMGEDHAEIARTDPGNKALQPINHILEKHHATFKNQLDAFLEYVAEAEREGCHSFPLYQWTKTTVEDPQKRAKHSKAFAIHVRGNEVYPKDLADALEAELQPLIGEGLLTKISRHDTNPANNIRPPADPPP